MLTSNEEEVQGLTPQEEKELPRVYDILCNFSKRSDLKKRIAVTNDMLNAELAKASEVDAENKARKSKGTAIVFDDSGIRMYENEIAHLNNELSALNRQPDRKITAQDLSEALAFLGQKLPRKEVEEMIWEVDEGLDGAVHWDEFKLMFERNIHDRTGLEPSKLYNLVQFLMYDAPSQTQQGGGGGQVDPLAVSGTISVDNTMKMLYSRFKRVKMEVKLRELFGEEMREYGKQGGEINFLQYLEAVQRIQMKTFWASPMGQLVLTSRVSGGESLREARAAMRAAERKMGGRKKGGIGPGPSTH